MIVNVSLRVGMCVRVCDCLNMSALLERVFASVSVSVVSHTQIE